MLCVSVNGRNDEFIETLRNVNPAPLHFSVDAVTGVEETAGVFPNLNAKYEEDADEVLQKFAMRAKKRIPGTEDEISAQAPQREMTEEGGMLNEGGGDDGGKMKPRANDDMNENKNKMRADQNAGGTMN